jgi:hypothetical protein
MKSSVSGANGFISLDGAEGQKMIKKMKIVHFFLIFSFL